jgi:hypothetical protein
MKRLSLAAVAMIAGLSAANAYAADPTAASLVGNYTVTGTATDGTAYEPGTLAITLEKSGAVALNWDEGEYLGVGQVSGNTLSVAAVADGKNSVMIMTINADGSLSGKWWRRTDPGTKGTEVWKKK